MFSFSTRFTALLLAFLPFSRQVYAGNGETSVVPKLDFVANQGQWPEPVRFRANVQGGAVFFGQEGFTYSYFSNADVEAVHEQRHHGSSFTDGRAIVHGHAYRVHFEGADQHALITGRDRQSTYHNYFLGSDPAHWAGGVPLFGRLRYSNVYPAIDLAVYSVGSAMKYDFVVAPGGDPAAIALRFDGVSPELLPNGDLRIVTSVNTVLEKAPVVYQMIEGRKTPVRARYVLHDNRVSFAFPEGYDKAYALVIDPTLVFGTYSGSSATTYGFSATYDLSGALYSGGECFNVGWPAQVGAFQTSYAGGVDAGINKYSTTGSTLIYSTYYGGGGSDLPNNMIVTAAGQLIMTGSTTSGNLPVTAGCYDASANGQSDAYVVRFNAGGTALVGATYIGGTSGDANGSSSVSTGYGDQNRGEVLTDAGGNIYVATTTSSADFPVTAGAYQTTFGGVQDAVLFKLSGDCSSLLWSTFLGGNNGDAAFSLVRTSSGALAVCGGTKSTNFPVTAGVYQPVINGTATEAFVAIINGNGSSLLRSTYLGTTGTDVGYKIQADQADDIYVMGQSAGAFPISSGVYSNPTGNIFIAKLDPTLSAILLSTKIGASGSTLVPSAFLYDNCGRVYFCGYQAGSGMPLTPNAFQQTPGGFWLCVLSTNMSSLLYGTYMGSGGDHLDGGTSRFDPQGIVYHSVCTGNTAFPTTPGVFAPTKNPGASFDIASFKFNFETTMLTAGIDLGTQNDSGCKPYTVIFNNVTVGADSWTWDFGDGTPLVSTQNVPPHTYYTPGVYYVKLYTSSGLCALADTSTVRITVLQPPNKPKLVLKDTAICSSDRLLLTANVLQPNNNLQFRWSPQNAINGANTTQTVLADPTIATTYSVIVTDSLLPTCLQRDTASFNLKIRTLRLAIQGDTTICPDDTTLLTAVYSTEGDPASAVSDFVWWPAGIRSSSPAPAQLLAWPTGNASYSVSAKNSYGCTASASTSVLVHDVPPLEAGENQIIRNGSSVQLNAFGGGGTYQWSPATGLSSATSPIPFANPPRTTTYLLTGTSVPDGCITTDSVTVTVVNVLVPTAFSPNGDGLNDVFRLLISNPAVVQVELIVYNRYGERIFRSEDVKKGWDGTHGGKLADIGTYFWKISYNIGHQNFTEKGDVSLIR